jgi:two-component system, OmpR family, copper resistance phosphate regulon response regulator CusR
MRVLLVEDDKDLREFISEGLGREGFTVDVATNGLEAVDQFQERAYDAVIMDVMMPQMDGISALRRLRMLGYEGAVILLTSRGQEIDKLDGFNSGADDYIVKPFLLSELVVRIRAILRRGKNTAKTGSVLKVGDIELNLTKREVRRGSKLITLTKREFDLLECLMRRPGHVLSQTILTQQVCQADFSTNTNTIEVHIKNLRAKLDKKSGPSVIRTVRGCGYAFEA